VTLEILPTGPNGLGIRQAGADHIYFMAPSSYSGDLRYSYDQFLTFSLRLSQEGARASIQDIIIEGRGVDSQAMKIALPIFAQTNPLPTREKQDYKFRLHEHPDYQWSPRLSTFDFQVSFLNFFTHSLRKKIIYTFFILGQVIFI
jgi:laminin, gamma 1